MSNENLKLKLDKLLINFSGAPIKQKRHQSCQDLHNQYREKNYGHVKSKVKKIIDQNSSEYSRKTLTRHKSMPESSQLYQIREDDPYKDEIDINVLKSELGKRSRQISDLNETIEETKQRVYALEIEKAQMRMTFDTIRLELHHYKEKERELKEKSSISNLSDISYYRSLRSVRDIDVQTDYSEMSSAAIIDNDTSYSFGPQPILNMFKKSTEELIKEKSVTINDNSCNRFINPLNRELTYTMTEEDISYYNMQNATSLTSNLSTDHLITTPSDIMERKKKKKLKHRLMKLMICVGSK